MPNIEIFGAGGHLREEAVAAILRDEKLDLLDGGLDEQIEAHKENCERCRRLWNEYYIEWQT